MGFDNECILNIQSLAGEYFCPVCRTLVYPHEALQAQCTHLYCKPCLAYVVSSTQACPYDGYLVTEAGSKPLMESNKALAETIGKTTVHCLYHRSGCVWQGPLSECTTHCSGCAFGNSPVVCNRCGIQIVHRQVQEHAQNCNVNGTNAQPQGSGTAQDAAASGAAVPVDQSKIANQATPPVSQPQASHAANGPSIVQNLNQPTTANQNYYQQYPGYDPYQQAYQQYYPYQQVQAPLQVQGQAQNQVQAQSQPQLQQQIQAPMQPQPQVQPQPQAQGQGQPQPLYPQAAVIGPGQNQGQVNPQQPHVHIQSQNQPLAHGHIPPQSYSQVQPHPVQNHAQPHMQVPHYQQPHPQMHPHPHPQTQSQPQPQPHPHFQPHSQPQPQSQPINPPHLPVQSMSGHPSYPSQLHQQIQHAPPQQLSLQVQPSMPAQFSQPPPNMLPLQGQAPGMPPTQQIHPHNQPGFPAHQRPVVHQVQQTMPQQYVQQPQAFPGQLQSQLHHAGPYAQQHSQVRPPGPPQPIQQPPVGFVQPQQGTALPHGMPPHSSQTYVGRPPMLNQGGQSQQFAQSAGAPGIAHHARPTQFGPSQPAVNQSNVNMTNQPHAYPEQQLNQYVPPLAGAMVDRKGDPTFDRMVEQQEDKSLSLKKSESVANDFGNNFNEVKPKTGMDDEHKTGNRGEDNHRKDEALTKDDVSELNLVQGVRGDSVTTQTMKEEIKDGSIDNPSGTKFSHNKAEDGGVATIDYVKQGEASLNIHGSSEIDNGSLAVPPGSSQGPPDGRVRIQEGHHDKTFSQSQTTPQSQIGGVSGGSAHPFVPYAPSGQQQRPAAPSLLQSALHTGQTLGQPPSHLRPPGHGYMPHGPHPEQVSNPGEHFKPPRSHQPVSFHATEFPQNAPPVPGSAASLGGGPNNFPNNRGYEAQSAGSHGQYDQGQIPQSSHARFSSMSQGEPFGPSLSSAPLPHGPDGQTVPRHPGPMETDMYQNQRPPHFDSRRPDSHIPGNVDMGPYGQPFGGELNSTRMNGAPPPDLDLSSAPVYHDEKYRTPAGMPPDTFLMGPTRHHEQGEFKGTLKQFPGPSHLGSDDSSNFGSRSSRQLGGYGMDGPSRFLDKDPHGYGYGAGQRVDPGSGGPPSGFVPPFHSAGGLHPHDSGGRPLPARMHDDNRGRFDNNRQNPDFLGPVHGFSRHHMDRLPPNSPGNPSRLYSEREMERRPFGERFPVMPPGYMHRGEFDGPGKPSSGEPFGLRGEPGFSSFQDYDRSGESIGPGGFSHQHHFGESLGTKSTRPHLGEPGFRRSYSRQGFPSDCGFYAGGPDSFDQLRKKKTVSMGWCRICKVDCESVEGLDMHGQTREHQRMTMDMVISIKQKSAKKQKTSNDLSAREDASKLRNAEIHARIK